MTVKTAESAEDILFCKNAVQALRPLLSDNAYQEAMRLTLEDNRQLIYIEGDGEAAAVAVFETGYNLFRGKYIYIDDLSTLAAYRGRGFAGVLVDWILDFARRHDFNQVHLDSGVSEARTDAHRLYLNKRFQITSLHFVANM